MVSSYVIIIHLVSFVNRVALLLSCSLLSFVTVFVVIVVKELLAVVSQDADARQSSICGKFHLPCMWIPTTTSAAQVCEVPFLLVCLPSIVS